MTSPRLEAGSFRDREGRVFYHDGQVHRALSATALAAYDQLESTRFFQRLVEAGRIVGTQRAPLENGALQAVEGGPWAGALRHETIPFVSYPYEWSFSMLRDGALLQLELVEAALGEGMILKDSSAYNVQFAGARPVFIDVASFEPLGEGEPWVGYLQFCQLFLYPLLLQAYKGVPYQPWLRGALDGITPEMANGLFSVRDRLRKGVLSHVYLQAKLQASANKKDAARRAAADSDNGAEQAQVSVRSDLRRAGFKKEMIVANVRGLAKLVRRLEWDPGVSEWGDYAGDNSYDQENRSIKESFVREAAAELQPELVWDLGANTGHFSRIAAEHSRQVVAFDADHLAVDRMYRALQGSKTNNILPLITNLADPAPGLGWRNRERKTLPDRGRPNLVLALALIHHVVITANVPLPEFIAYLAELGTDLVIEFVTKDDARVRELLRNKDDIYHDYELPVFEQELQRHYRIERRVEYHGGTRKLYFARLG